MLVQSWCKLWLILLGIIFTLLFAVVKWFPYSYRIIETAAYIWGRLLLTIFHLTHGLYLRAASIRENTVLWLRWKTMHNWKTYCKIITENYWNPELLKSRQYFHTNYIKEHLFFVKTETALIKALNKTFTVICISGLQNTKNFAEKSLSDLAKIWEISEITPRENYSFKKIVTAKINLRQILC